jgi:threonine synthase
MIEQHAKGGHRHFAISSSGNAALAAALYISEYNGKYAEQPIDLQIFVGEHINDAKLARLREIESKDHNITITQNEKPKQSVHVLNKRGEAKSLRQSMDPLALIGYMSLVDELREIQNISNIFVPTSSGTVAEALATHFPTHIVQTTQCHPISELFDKERAGESSESLADAIVDLVAPRKDALVKIIKTGWIITNEEIEIAVDLMREETSLEISPNSALSIAGLMRALKTGLVPDGPIVCLITGR